MNIHLSIDSYIRSMINERRKSFKTSSNIIKSNAVDRPIKIESHVKYIQLITICMMFVLDSKTIF